MLVSRLASLAPDSRSFKTIAPRAFMPTMWKTFLPRSTPIVVTISLIATGPWSVLLRFKGPLPKRDASVSRSAADTFHYIWCPRLTAAMILLGSLVQVKGFGFHWCRRGSGG
jgi:hypothetical protein